MGSSDSSLSEATLPGLLRMMDADATTNLGLYANQTRQEDFRWFDFCMNSIQKLLDSPTVDNVDDIEWDGTSETGKELHAKFLAVILKLQQYLRQASELRQALKRLPLPPLSDSPTYRTVLDNSDLVTQVLSFSRMTQPKGLEECRAELETANHRIEQLLENNTSLDVELRIQAKTMRDLARKEEQWSIERAHCEAQLTDAHAEIKRQDQVIRKAEEERVRLTEEHAASLERFRSELQKEFNALYSEENDILKQSNIAVRTRNQSLQASIVTVNTAREEMERERSRLRSELEGSQTQHKAIQERLEQCGRELEVAMEEFRQSREDLHDCRSLVDQLSTSLQGTKEEIERLTSEVREAQEQEEQALSQKGEVEHARTLLASEIETLRQQQASTGDRLQQCLVDLENRTQASQQSEERIREYETRMQATLMQLQSALEGTKQLEMEIDRENSERDGVAGERDRLRVELEAIRAQQAATLRSLEDCHRDLEEARQNPEPSCRAQLEQCQTHLREATEAARVTDDRLRQLESEMEECGKVAEREQQAREAVLREVRAHTGGDHGSSGPLPPPGDAAAWSSAVTACVARQRGEIQSCRELLDAEREGRLRDTEFYKNLHLSNRKELWEMRQTRAAEAAAVAATSSAKRSRAPDDDDDDDGGGDAAEAAPAGPSNPKRPRLTAQTQTDLSGDVVPLYVDLAAPPLGSLETAAAVALEVGDGERPAPPRPTEDWYWDRHHEPVWVRFPSVVGW